MICVVANALITVIFKDFRPLPAKLFDAHRYIALRLDVRTMKQRRIEENVCRTNCEHVSATEHELTHICTSYVSICVASWLTNNFYDCQCLLQFSVFISKKNQTRSNFRQQRYFSSIFIACSGTFSISINLSIFNRKDLAHQLRKSSNADWLF